MKRIVTLVVVGLVCAAFGFAGGGQETGTGQTPEEIQLNWAAAGVGGTYYPLCIGLSKIIHEYYPEINITIETTGGGVANARLVGTGDNDIGLSNSNFCLFATQGTGPYKEPHVLYAVAYVYPAALHILVNENSPIKSLHDVKGKKIAVGPAGGGTIQVFRDMFPFYGLEESDLKLSYISFADGANALRDGNVDVNMVIAGPPAGVAKELMETAKVRFISVETDVIEAMKEKYGYYLPVVFPKSMFGTPEDVTTIGGGVQWIVRDGLSEDVVYKMTKAVFEHLDEAKQIHPVARYIDPQTAITVSIPLHPGAEKYYREIGVLK